MILENFLFNINVGVNHFEIKISKLVSKTGDINQIKSTEYEYLKTSTESMNLIILNIKTLKIS